MITMTKEQTHTHKGRAANNYVGKLGLMSKISYMVKVYLTDIIWSMMYSNITVTFFYQQKLKLIFLVYIS